MSKALDDEIQYDNHDDEQDHIDKSLLYPQDAPTNPCYYAGASRITRTIDKEIVDRVSRIDEGSEEGDSERPGD